MIGKPTSPIGEGLWRQHFDDEFMVTSKSWENQEVDLLFVSIL
jgi:hypothetical protein